MAKVPAEIRQSEIERVARAVAKTGIPARILLPSGKVIAIGQSKLNESPESEEIKL
jgi:hypothetical protein